MKSYGREDIEIISICRLLGIAGVCCRMVALGRISPIVDLETNFIRIGHRTSFTLLTLSPEKSNCTDMLKWYGLWFMSIRYTGSHVVGPKGTACLAGLNIKYKKTRDIKLVRCL